MWTQNKIFSSNVTGFSTGNKTWLPINENYLETNVESESSVNTAESHIKVYKELVKLRQSNTWKYGEYQSFTLEGDDVLGFTRYKE
jgi:alpha-glucosidase